MHVPMSKIAGMIYWNACQQLHPQRIHATARHHTSWPQVHTPFKAWNACSHREHHVLLISGIWQRGFNSEVESKDGAITYLAKPTICKTGEMDEIVAIASLGLIMQQTWPKIHLQVYFRDAEINAKNPHQNTTCR